MKKIIFYMKSWGKFFGWFIVPSLGLMFLWMQLKGSIPMLLLLQL